MIISLIAHEKNLGILTLTDHLLSKLGKTNCVVVGWNYLVLDHQLILKKINEATQKNKSVIVKYMVPRYRFSSNQTLVYPEVLKDLSDVVFRVPTYREEISVVVPKIYLKGNDNPITKHLDKFYQIT